MEASRRRWPLLLVVALTISLLTVVSQATLAKPPKGDPSLRGSWSLDEASGLIAKDSSAYKNHGSIQNATWVPGKYGTALHFDGVGDRVVVPESGTLEPENVSLALWFKATRLPPDWNWKVIAYKGVINCTASSFALGSANDDNDADNGLIFSIYSWDSRQNRYKTIYTPPEPVPDVWDGKWHHAVGTFDGSRLRLYVDGSLASQWDWSGAIKYDMLHGDEFVIGNPNPVTMCQDRNYVGDIDEVRVWDRALSAKEVARLANPKTGKKPKR